MRLISYSDAIKRFGNSYILSNSLIDNDSTILENCRFDWEDGDGNLRDIYQWFITDCSGEDVRFLEDWFGLLFSYSEMLDCYILCVDHCGTPWRGVMIEDNSPKC